MSDVPGPVVEPLQETARRLGVHVVVGTYERGPERGVVYNASVLLGRDGEVARHLPQDAPVLHRDALARRLGDARATRSAWSRPTSAASGRSSASTATTPSCPGSPRSAAPRSSCRPSALLRSADIWELTNRARAYDNHVYVVGANATGVDPGGVLYFGNSMIVTPIAEVVARAASHECWVSARLDPATAMALAHPGLERAAGLRPPGRPQPRPDHAATPTTWPGRRRRRSRTPSRRRAGRLPVRDRRRTVNGACRRRQAIRIGIDTGGTFTDVVALDEDTGRRRHHQDPVDAGRPRRRASSTGVAQGARA